MLPWRALPKCGWPHGGLPVFTGLPAPRVAQAVQLGYGGRVLADTVQLGYGGRPLAQAVMVGPAGRYNASAAEAGAGGAG